MDAMARDRGSESSVVADPVDDPAGAVPVAAALPVLADVELAIPVFVDTALLALGDVDFGELVEAAFPELADAAFPVVVGAVFPVLVEAGLLGLAEAASTVPQPAIFHTVQRSLTTSDTAWPI